MIGVFICVAILCFMLGNYLFQGQVNDSISICHHCYCFSCVLCVIIDPQIVGIFIMMCDQSHALLAYYVDHLNRFLIHILRYQWQFRNCGRVLSRESQVYIKFLCLSYLLVSILEEKNILQDIA